jgi:hypothetical protein
MKHSRLWVSTVVALTAAIHPRDAAGQRGRSTPTRVPPAVAAVADSTTAWIPMTAAEWYTRAPELVGKSVEVSGKLHTMLMVKPQDSFSNGGWMRDSNNKVLATVLFDQVGRDLIVWMASNNCGRLGCDGVFVRGMVYMPERSREPVLRVSQVSFESHAGAAPVSLATLDTTVVPNTSSVEKVLLPSGGVPTDAATAKWRVTRMPGPAPDTTAGMSIRDQMVAHSNFVLRRERNLDLGIMPGPKRASDFTTAYRSIRDTKLANMFAKSSWNLGSNPWPRVALIVEERQRRGTSLSSLPGSAVIDGCWRVSAKVWTGPAAHEDIAPFNWCLSEMRFNVSYETVVMWGRTPKTSMISSNTGRDRTLGPNPPSTPAPRFQYSNAGYVDTIMLGNLLMDMGFSFSEPDGRVWVIDATK